MPRALFDKVIQELTAWEGPRVKVLKLCLYGEPLLNRELGEWVRIAHAASVADRIETTTNAALLHADIAAELVRHGLDYLRVSIYSAIPDRHQQITGSRVTVEEIHANLAQLQRLKQEHGTAKPFVAVKTLDTYGPDNEVFAERFRDVADEIYFDQPHGWVAFGEKDYIGDLYGAAQHRARTAVARNNSARIACTLPFFTLAVRSSGEVSPCCVDWIGGTNIGDVREERLRDIWRGDRMFEFRRMQLEGRRHDNPSCRGCQVCLSDYYTRDNVDGFPVSRLREVAR
jgi:radical SAM protein with 4Fe4S-binding SPASM domain